MSTMQLAYLVMSCLAFGAFGVVLFFTWLTTSAMSSSKPEAKPTTPPESPELHKAA